MNVLGFKPDRKITDVLAEGFTLSAEIIPPRNGAEQQKVFAQISSLIKAGAQFLAVTKGAGGSLRAGSLPIAQSIKEQMGVPCIAHFTCRDLTPHEVENHLIDHHYFGIRNILALRGDPPQDQLNWTPKAGSYSYAHELIQQIRSLNQGHYLTRADERAMNHESTDFCIGAAVYPEHPDPKERTDFFRQKIEAGADYAITQMVFDADAYARFSEDCQREKLNVPILPGTRLLKSKKQAARMAARFQVSVPSKLMHALPEEETPETLTQAIDAFLDFVEGLKQAGAPGLHLFVLSDTSGSCEILRRLLAKP